MTLPADPLDYPLRLARLVRLAIDSEHRAPPCSCERWQRGLRADRLTRALADLSRPRFPARSLRSTDDAAPAPAAP